MRAIWGAESTGRVRNNDDSDGAQILRWSVGPAVRHNSFLPSSARFSNPNHPKTHRRWLLFNNDCAGVPIR